MAELLLRFVLGGAIVSAFAAVAELFEPKTFAGLFGAAPSVAIATLALTHATRGPAAAASAARWMLVATGAFLAYAVCCVALCRRRRVPVWLAAVASWLAWAAAAAALWLALHTAVPS